MLKYCDVPVVRRAGKSIDDVFNSIVTKVRAGAHEAVISWLIANLGSFGNFGTDGYNDRAALL